MKYEYAMGRLPTRLHAPEPIFEDLKLNGPFMDEPLLAAILRSPKDKKHRNGKDWDFKEIRKG